MPMLAVTSFQKEHINIKILIILHIASYKRKIVICLYSLPWVDLMNFHLPIWFWADFHEKTIINNIILDFI